MNPPEWKDLKDLWDFFTGIVSGAVAGGYAVYKFFSAKIAKLHTLVEAKVNQTEFDRHRIEVREGFEKLEKNADKIFDRLDDMDKEANARHIALLTIVKR